MEAKAVAKFIHVSPRKMRLVANTIRGYEFPDAYDTLKFLPNKGARLLLKVLNSARANASNLDEKVQDNDLYVKKVYIDVGPIMRRFMPRARGRATRIRKRLANITVVLGTD